MLIIKPIQDKSEQEALCASCGVAYNPDALAYKAEVDEIPVGICQFRIRADAGYITDLAGVKGTDDWEALFIMGRQTMNFIDLHGVHRGIFAGKADEGLIKALGFEREGEIWALDLEDFFAHPCAAERAKAKEKN